MNMSNPLEYTAKQLHAGLSAEFNHSIKEEDIRRFAHLSGDVNPLHLSQQYAQSVNYKKCIVHGAYQIALASKMVGMYVPGLKTVIGSIYARFSEPLYYPCQVTVKGVLTSWEVNTLSGQVNVSIINKDSGVVSAKIGIGVSLQEDRPQVLQVPNKLTSAKAKGRKTILVTGAAGGIGCSLCHHLYQEYDILALVNKTPLDEKLKTLPGVMELNIDLSAENWVRSLRRVLNDKELYAIIHAAWPGVPHGGLFDVDTGVLSKQIHFGLYVPLELGRVLYERVHESGGRFIVMGSGYGHNSPQLQLSAYSLGKAVLEDFVRLISPELARKKICVNAICPSFVPVGMNEKARELDKKKQEAKVPLGRLCMPADVCSLTHYLLQPEASFISGQHVQLSGASL